MFSLDHIHNQLIHFPIGLLSASVFFDTFGIISKNEKLHIVSWYTLMLGTISAVASVLTGFIEDQTYGHMSDPLPIHETHGSMQIIATIIFTTLLLWRMKFMVNDSQPPSTYIAISALAVIILFYGSHLGAILAGLV